jgi:hypothetical protein
MQRLFAFLLFAALIGCARTATLYPANQAAGEIGVLKANFTAYGTGGGPMTITLPNCRTVRFCGANTGQPTTAPTSALALVAGIGKSIRY